MSVLAGRRKFLSYFPDGFRDETYVAWERGYKLKAHERWEETLGSGEMKRLLRAGEHREICQRAISIESRTNLLFSFEKMAIRDAVKPRHGARAFAEGLFGLTAGRGDVRQRFEHWCNVVTGLPRPGTRVFTWPVVTVFGFIALPEEHFFLKPNVTRRAAVAYGAPFAYASRPTWDTYADLLDLARQVRKDLADLKPRDMIDIQSFLWVLGSDEYP